MATLGGGVQGLAASVGNGLDSTLTGQQILTQLEALRQKQQEALMQQSQQASQAAQGAQENYAQAAAAPPPDVAPGDQFIQTLFGNIASTIAQDPKFRESAIERIQNQRNQLMKARQDNLVQLRDTFMQRAQELERIGDPSAADLRGKIEQLNKQLEVTLDQQKLDARAQENRDAAQNQRERDKQLHLYALDEIAARAKADAAGLSSDETVNNYATAAVNGEIAPANIPSKIRGAVLKEIQARGEVILPPKVRDSVGALGSAMGVLDQLRELSLGPAGPDGQRSGGLNSVEGGNALALLQHGGALAFGASPLSGQSNPDAALYQAARQGFLSTISRSTGEVGVLTDRDVMRARNLLPNFTDSKEVAESLLYQLEQFLRTRQFQLKRAYTTPGAGVTAPAEQKQKSESKRIIYDLVDGKLVPRG